MRCVILTLQYTFVGDIINYLNIKQSYTVLPEKEKLCVQEKVVFLWYMGKKINASWYLLEKCQGSVWKPSSYLNSFYSYKFKEIKMRFNFRNSKELHQARKKRVKLKLSLEYNYLNLVCKVQKISFMISNMPFRKISSC